MQDEQTAAQMNDSLLDGPPSNEVEATTSEKPHIVLPVKSPIKHRLWYFISRSIIILLGATITAAGFVLFQMPHEIAAGGVSGISLIINKYTGLPVGGLFLLINIPLLFLGYFHLGKWPFVLRTIFGVVVFSVATELFNAYLPTMIKQYPLSNDILLCSIYAGLIMGIGSGIVYHAGATTGGTAIVGRIIQLKTGTPLSQVYLFSDGGIVLLAGALFGWEVSLYAMLTLFLSGIASDYTLEGPSSIRIANIITDNPVEVSGALMKFLGRGVSSWEITGTYTGQKHAMLMCTVFRPQVPDLKKLVAETDHNAFVTISSGHQAIGNGFMRPKSH